MQLAISLNKKILFINPSTDCVFNGKKKNNGYLVNDYPNAIDDYGKSKIIAEKSISFREKILIPRTSIIGFEKMNKKFSLLEWALSQRNKKINGYKNHYWNGVTTLEWCKLMYELLEGKIQLSEKLFHIGMNKKISKYVLLKNINDIFTDNKLIIKPVDHSFTNRYLIPNLVANKLSNQLLELKNLI